MAKLQYVLALSHISQAFLKSIRVLDRKHLSSSIQNLSPLNAMPLEPVQFERITRLNSECSGYAKLLKSSTHKLVEKLADTLTLSLFLVSPPKYISIDISLPLPEPIE